MFARFSGIPRHRQRICTVHHFPHSASLLPDHCKKYLEGYSQNQLMYIVIKFVINVILSYICFELIMVREQNYVEYAK